MRRREFLKTVAGVAGAAMTSGAMGAGEVRRDPESMRVRTYLRSIMPSREGVKNFILGRQGPEKLSRNQGWMFDADLGWALCDAVRGGGVDSSKGFYHYEADGARKVVNFADKPCRIHTYGDSFTHCDQVNDGETWQEYLAAHLQEPVRNYGVGGYSVYQAYRRMLKVEEQDAAEYIILNIYDEDHFRNLDAWRAIRFGQSSICGYALPHLKVNVRGDRCRQIDNISVKPEEVYQLCDEDFVWQTFKDDPVLQLMLAKRVGGKPSREAVKSVAAGFGVDYEKIAETEPLQQLQKIHTEAALYATKNVVTWTEQFVKKTGKKLMLVLSFCEENVAADLQGKPRFDQNFVDWLGNKPYPVIDMRDAFKADYRQFNVDVRTYLKRYYIGHHSPAGNFFTAWAIKDKIVEWLKPRPLPYR